MTTILKTLAANSDLASSAVLQDILNILSQESVTQVHFQSEESKRQYDQSLEILFQRLLEASPPPIKHFLETGKAPIDQALLSSFVLGMTMGLRISAVIQNKIAEIIKNPETSELLEACFTKKNLEGFSPQKLSCQTAMKLERVHLFLKIFEDLALIELCADGIQYRGTPSACMLLTKAMS